MSEYTSRGYLIPQSQTTLFPDLWETVTAINNDVGGVVSGAFSSPMTTLGDIIYGATAGAATRLAGNTSASNKFLRQVGTGSISADPSWETLVAGDIPDISATYATRSYADSLVVGLLDDRGNYDASGNVFPSSGGSGTAGAILKGDLWTISVAGTLGGHAVTAGDVVRALVDSPGSTDSNWAISENNFGYVALNQSLADGKIYVGNASGIGTAVTPSGDVTMTNAGVTTIGALKVTNAMLAGSIAASKLIGTDIATVGTLTAGATGAGFTVALSTSTITGTLGATNGGTGQSTYALGDTLYSSATNVLSKLSGNTTTTRKFLRQTGNGSVSAAPAWDTLVSGDIPDLSGTYQPLDADLTEIAAVANVRGDLLVTNSVPTWVRLAVGSASTLLQSNGTDPSWGTVNLLSAFHGDTTTGTVTRGDVITGQGATPKWTRLALTVPSAGIQNYFGISNAETEPSWKSASSNPGAAASILATDASGNVQLVNLTLSGNLSTSRVVSHLIPSVTDTYDLGSSTLLWRKGWLSELDAVLFAQNVISVVGGWLLVSKNEGLIPVGQDIGTGDTTIDFGQSMTPGDFVVFRAAGAVEYVQVGLLSSGTRYNVTRNLDGSGANAWPAGSVYVVLGYSSDLTTSLAAYWSLEEASGNRADSFGSTTLTDNNTVTQNPGKVGNAGQFTSANSESLSVTDNATVSTGDIDFTFTVWVYADSLTGANRFIISKTNGSTLGEYFLQFNNAVNRFRFGIQNGSTFVTIDANSLGAPSTSTWYFIRAWHDSVANTVNIQVNNGAIDSASTGATVPADSAQPFYIGARSDATTFWNGRIDEVGFWKRTLSIAEGSALYNGGSGLAYPLTVPGVGRVEINANSSPRISVITQGSTYNAQTELLRFGDLNGWGAYTAETWGFATGQYGTANKSWITVEQVNGLRIGNNTTSLFNVDLSGNVRIGTDISAAATTRFFISNASQTYNSEAGFVAGDVLFGDSTAASNKGNVKITNAGQIAIRRGTTNYITLDATDAQFTNLIKMTGASAAISLGTTPPTSASVGTGIWLDRTGLFGLNANTVNFKIDATNGNITAIAGTIGAFTLGATRISSTNLFIDQAGQYISGGATPPTSYGNNVGFFIEGANSGRMSFYKDANNYLQWDNAKLIWKGANTSLDSSGNLTASSATISVAAGNITLDSNGLTLIAPTAAPTSVTSAPSQSVLWKSGSTSAGSVIVDYEGSIPTLHLFASTGHLQVNPGFASVNTQFLSFSPTGGIGYGAGAGGAVTQSTSKSTGVTINKVCGAITMNNAALAAGAKVSFVVTNSTVEAGDLPKVGVKSGGTANAYRADVTAIAAGSFTITVENITAGSLSEAPVITFGVYKGVTA